MAVGPKIQVRHDTTANWAAANPTLAAGEVGLDTTLGKFKVGDGSTAWTTLGFYKGVAAVSTGAPASPTSGDLWLDTDDVAVAGVAFLDSEGDPAAIGTVADGTSVYAARRDHVHAISGQLAFPATQNASAEANTLDDYEEGTWTPTVTFSGGNGNLTYNNQIGGYTKIGRQVTLTGYVDFNKGTASGTLRFTGTPFDAGTHYSALSLRPVGFAVSAVTICGFADGTSFYIEYANSGGSLGSITDALLTVNPSFVFHATFYV